MPHKPSIGATVRCRPNTIASGAYTADGKPQQRKLIASPHNKPASPCLLGLPEGLYMAYRSRGLQIASSVCGQGRCYIAQVCRCVSTQQNKHPYAGSAETQRPALQAASKAEVQDVPLSWDHHVYERDGLADTLLLAPIDGDSDLLPWDNNEYQVHSWQDELPPPPPPPPLSTTHAHKFSSTRLHTTGKRTKKYQSGVLGFIKDAWQKYLDRGTYDSGGRPGPGPGPRPGGSHSTDDDALEWDDTDVPIPVQFYSAPPALDRERAPDDFDIGSEFDLFNDVIEEEFPRIGKALRERERRFGRAGPATCGCSLL
ncbi:hypothetical protein GGR50DRAFT_698023 [Xylaria sp. CBS 124048]|nr:hypothetical protein GGR50DRAFT_698023 [Xylaria sp. CBS 124048]